MRLKVGNDLQGLSLYVQDFNKKRCKDEEHLKRTSFLFPLSDSGFSAGPSHLQCNLLVPNMQGSLWRKYVRSTEP